MIQELIKIKIKHLFNDTLKLFKMNSFFIKEKLKEHKINITNF